MLFYSGVFLLAFLPATLYAYFLLKPWRDARVALLIAASLAFYGYWEWRHLPILVGSILVNYLVHYRLTCGTGTSERSRRLLLAGGIATNLLLLGWFKYSSWVTDILGLGGASEGGEFSLGTLALPLGISFFTFQQISMLVDTWRNRTRYGLPDIACYVSFFPQLIAGPIVRHDQLIPQLHCPPDRARHLQMAIVGVAIFFVGYLKKVYLADNFAIPADQLFLAASQDNLNLREAWIASLSYTFQLYFDFSGYADMAIGLGLLFGIRLPTNFDSPYRASSLIDFWRRWHQTLSSFLRDYLYIPLGGSRRGMVRMFVALLITMLLGGLWHGAGWTFVIWGGSHGLLLSLNHLWRRAGMRLPWPVGWAITFLVVVVGWVFFRAPDLQTAQGILQAMFTFNDRQFLSVDEAWMHFLVSAEQLGFGLISPYWGGGRDAARSIAFILTGIFITLALPNSNRLLLLLERPASVFRKPRLAFSAVCLLAFAAPAAADVVVVVTEVLAQAFAPPKFIYFNF